MASFARCSLALPSFRIFLRIFGFKVKFYSKKNGLGEKISHGLTFAISAFGLILGVLALAKFKKFLKRSTIKTGLNAFSYFPA